MIDGRAGERDPSWPSAPFHNYGDVFSISSCRRKPASRYDEARNRNWIPAFAGMPQYITEITVGSTQSPFLTTSRALSR
jgi:hypothetical protein